MVRREVLVALVLWWGLASPGVAAQGGAHIGADPLEAEVTRPNLLLIIGDDMGVDRVAAYGEHPEAGPTPTLDGLAADGVLFRNAWANGTCSPTRATLLTGRYGFRTGVGRSITYVNGDWELSVHEPSLAWALRGGAPGRSAVGGAGVHDPSGGPPVRGPRYHTAAVGKWHLGTASGSGLAHAQLLGFEHHHGPMDNLSGATGETYFDFAKNVDGVLQASTTYATTDQVDDALALIGALPEPWFTWLAFSAPHGPFHAPPDELHDLDLPPAVDDDVPLHHRAMTQALDTEVGRLLDGLDPEVRARTVIVFIGDNGTPTSATTPPFHPDHAKATAFEGGVNVPLIVAGPGVAAGAECAALVNATDLFATFCELAGVPGGASGDPVGDPVGPGLVSPDSISLVPYLSQPDLPSLRAWVYTDGFAPNGAGPWLQRSRAVREARFKLIHRELLNGNEVELLFDLDADPFEQVDLLRAGPLSPEAQAAHDALWAVLDDLEP